MTQPLKKTVQEKTIKAIDNICARQTSKICIYRNTREGMSFSFVPVSDAKEFLDPIFEQELDYSNISHVVISGQRRHGYDVEVYFIQ